MFVMGSIGNLWMTKSTNEITAGFIGNIYIIYDGL